VLGYAFADSLHADVVETALRRAVTFRGADTSGVIFHADRGCQGGFNRSSQHLVIREVFGGTSSADSRSGASAGDAVAWPADSGEACGA
jgi:hypothetical protein